MTELFMENYRLDISSELSTLLNFAIDDIKNFASRSTSWSKTIILPGTANNNRTFGHIFQIGQTNVHNDLLNNVGYNFNAAKAANIIIFQDQMQTFKGVLRLMQINIHKGKIEYEVAVFGELAGLNVALSSGKLEELDFSAYDHAYTAANIVSSWDTINGSGYYYPLIDHGGYSVAKANWDIRTFRPALYAKEYIDKMFEAANYRYSSALFDTARFKSLIIPYNRKALYSTASAYLDARVSTQQVISPGPFITKINFPDEQINTAFTTASNNTFTYNQASTITVTINLNISGTMQGSEVLYLVRRRGGTPEAMGFTTVSGASGGSSFDVTVSAEVELQQNDEIYASIANLNAGDFINIDAGYLKVLPGPGLSTEISVGGDIGMNSCIPSNIRQVDFLSSIVKLFNLYVYESLTDQRLILITPYVDFYSTDSTDSVDWTYKLNREKPVKIRPMSELNSKKYEYKYKSDSDYYNDLYRKRYGIGYGDFVFDSQYEFASQTNSLELIFSATPLVGYTGEDKVYSTIFKQSNNTEESTDHNIRILLAKKVTSVTSWDILDGVSVLDSLTDYGYAGHFDDPDAPSNDLNFGVPAELFFELVTGDLTKTQFNLYWSSYMAEITDKDSKLMSAWFYLTALDIARLDFSKKVFVDGNLFRLNSIKDYNASKPTDCQVELLKVNYLIY